MSSPRVARHPRFASRIAAIIRSWLSWYQVPRARYSLVRIRASVNASATLFGIPAVEISPRLAVPRVPCSVMKVDSIQARSCSSVSSISRRTRSIAAS